MTETINTKEDAVKYLREELSKDEFRYPHHSEVTPTEDGIDIYFSMKAETGEEWELNRRVEEKQWRTNKRLDAIVTVIRNAHLESSSEPDKQKE